MWEERKVTLNERGKKGDQNREAQQERERRWGEEREKSQEAIQPIFVRKMLTKKMLMKLNSLFANKNISMHKMIQPTTLPNVSRR